jgi:hypothetical protein
VRLLQLIGRWRARRDDLQHLGALVDGVKLCEEVVADLESIMSADDYRVLTLAQAETLSGYSREHLGRLIRNGKIPNAGRPNAPRIRRQDLPRKPGHLPPEGHELHIGKTSTRQIVRSIVEQR